ncbi:MAG: three-Cys-motif partner protein TcmP [Deltaproteobacteria bacterium]|nr:three-Cys-motif partner protein TcmP [Deltaproteobacteria bacterium]
MVSELEFFKGKRPWSKIKDRVIGGYLVPYLRKVSKLNRKIILVDAFAGPAIFEDGTKGSPLIICEIADKHASNQYLAVFINKDRNSHVKLEKNLKKYIQSEKAIPLYGNAQELLKVLKDVVGDATFLVYLDPFGLKGLEFPSLEPYLGRDRRFSTEIIINISMPTLHRLATYKARSGGTESIKTNILNQRLTKILGGDYWQSIMWSNLSANEKERQVVEKYVGLLKRYLPYAGYCPVREKPDGRVKYYIIFCSRHQDALFLMNDIMYTAYYETLHEMEWGGTLFEAFDWKKIVCHEKEIEEEILTIIKDKPGIARKECWFELIKTNFMKWNASEYKKNVKKLLKENKIMSDCARQNDDSRLYPINHSNFRLKTLSRLRTHYKTYKTLEGEKVELLEKVNDGSIITRFDKTAYPQRPSDIVCPHFLELKWAYGCPFDCAWCYLKGTFRFRPERLKPTFKPLEKVKLHVDAFLEQVETPEILNTGEIADSLMGEGGDYPFSKFIISLFQRQKRHKVLFVTKSANIKHLLKIPDPQQAIISFSLNAEPVAQRWERRAPSVMTRIEAARKLYEHGYEVRIRVDPMVPVEEWDRHYLSVVDIIFDSFVPERITLGSLRGLQSTINGVKDKSWTVYLKENSNWGKKIDFKTRYKMYQMVIRHLKDQHDFSRVALCKETVAMWKKLKMDWKQVRCNCIW